MELKKQIKKDLYDIRYFYNRKKVMNEGLNAIGSENNKVVELINKYNEMISRADACLYDIYVSLYLKNHTQESLANELGLTQTTVWRENQKLISYFEKCLIKEEK